MPRRRFNAIGYRGSLAERFMQKLIPEPNSGCWLWLGSIDRKGYGQIREAGAVGKARLRPATHVALELSGYRVPPGMYVLHHCDVPACVNPGHLFIGTALDNTRDMMRKGRESKPPLGRKFAPGDNKKTECLRGHPMIAENLILLSSGRRQCRACQRGRKALRRAAFVAKGLRCDGLPRQTPSAPSISGYP